MAATDPLPDGWSELTADDGRPYFFHEASNTTQWERPGAAPSDPLPDGWTELTTEDGRAYFFHEASNTTQWERPNAAPSDPLPDGWAELTTEDGRTYYEHAGKNVTQWERPTEAPAEEQEGPQWTPGSAAVPAPLAVQPEEPLEPLEEHELSLLSYFEDIDIDRTGFVTLQSMKRYTEDAGLEMSESDMRQAIAAQDANNDGRISLREFLLTQQREPPCDQEWFLKHLFDRFAALRSAGISPVELRKVLDTLEVSYDDDRVRNWMQHPAARREAGMKRLPFEGFVHVFCPYQFQTKP